MTYTYYLSLDINTKHRILVDNPISKGDNIFVKLDGIEKRFEVTQVQHHVSVVRMSVLAVQDIT